MGTKQFFVTLVLLDDTVLATHDNLVLGPCAALSDAPALAAAFAAAAQSGASLAARAYVAAGRIAVDLPIDPEVLFAPAVPPLPLDPDKPAIPPVLNPNADWEFTTPAEPLASPLPAGPRAFASPKDTF